MPSQPSYQCKVILGVTKIPGTEGEKEFGNGTTDNKSQCKNVYVNASQGVKLGYCDVHYEEYKKEAF